MNRLRDMFGLQDVALLVSMGLIGGGVAAFDWRVALVVTGGLILGLTVWGLKNGNNNQPGGA